MINVDSLSPKERMRVLAEVEGVRRLVAATGRLEAARILHMLNGILVKDAKKFIDERL